MSDGPPSHPAPGGHDTWRDRFPPVGYWLRVGVMILGIVIALQVLVALQSVLLVVLASAVLAIGLQPAIRWLERRGVTSALAMAAIMVAGLVLFGGLLLLTIPRILQQVGELAEAIPAAVREIEYGSGFVADLEDQFGILDRMSSLQDELPGGVVAVAGAVGTAVFQLVLVLILTPYFALAVPGTKRWIVRLARPEQREDILYVMNRSTDLMANYIAGNLFVSLVAGTVAFVGLLAIGVPYVTTLAVFVALTDMIPAVGATIGAVVVVAVAGLEGTGEMVAAAILIIGYQQVENFVIVPRVMKEAIDVRPATGIVALLAGGTLAGPIGALLALPVAAMVKIVLEEYVIRRRMEHVQTADAEAQAAGGRRARRPGRRGLARPPLP